MLDQKPGADGIAAAPDSGSAEAPLIETRFRYRLHDLTGTEVGTVECAHVLEQDELIEIRNERWRIVSTVGGSARVSRL